MLLGHHNVVNFKSAPIGHPGWGVIQPYDCFNRAHAYNIKTKGTCSCLSKRLLTPGGWQSEFCLAATSRSDNITLGSPTNSTVACLLHIHDTTNNIKM